MLDPAVAYSIVKVAGLGVKASAPLTSTQPTTVSIAEKHSACSPRVYASVATRPWRIGPSGVAPLGTRSWRGPGRTPGQAVMREALLPGTGLLRVVAKTWLRKRPERPLVVRTHHK